jgi:hypothetical protein
MAASGYTDYGSLHFPGKKANIQRLAGERRLAWRCPSLAAWPSLDRLKVGGAPGPEIVRNGDCPCSSSANRDAILAAMKVINGTP